MRKMKKRLQHVQNSYGCFCLLLLLPNIRNSCLNFPLSCVSIVLRQGGNWSLRARGDSCLFSSFFFSSFSSERQQSYPFIKRACSRFMQPGSTEVKNGKQLLLYFVAAIKLSLSYLQQICYQQN